MEIKFSNVVPPDQKPPEKEGGDEVLKVVSACGGFAFGTVVLGSFLSEPWPAAVAACGICVMGLGAAYFVAGKR